MTLDPITSQELAPVAHAFFSRRGGASSGIFAGLNCSLGSSDQADAVKLNRSRVIEAMGLSPDGLVGVHQVHSATAITIDGPLAAPLPHADGIATATPGLGLGILTADCAPVLFSDPEAGVIGAAHAGWKGGLGGVLEATLEAMERLGAKRGDTRAVIGPTISQRAYEVGPEFLDDFLADDPDNARFFANGKGDRYQFDLPGYGLARMRAAGIGAATWTGHCTYTDPDRFYSFRRSVHEAEADYGRLMSVIRL